MLVLFIIKTVECTIACGTLKKRSSYGVTNALVTLLLLRISMVGDNHLPLGDMSARLPHIPKKKSLEMKFRPTIAR